MNLHFSRPVLVMVFFLALTLHAPAATVADTARKWGLIGTWSRDCSLPPGKDKSAVLAYVIGAGDQLMHRRDFGDSRDENPVVGAEVSADGMLNLRVFFPNFKQTREYGLVMQSDGTMQTTYNRGPDERYSIKDGKFTANGSPTPALHKCG